MDYPPTPQRHASAPMAPSSSSSASAMGENSGRSQPSLPLLDLSSLTGGGCASRLCARDAVDAISSSLSAIRPYLLVGSQAALLTLSSSSSRSSASSSSSAMSNSFLASATAGTIGNASNGAVGNSSVPTHVVSFATSTTPQLERRQRLRQPFLHRSVPVFPVYHRRSQHHHQQPFHHSVRLYHQRETDDTHDEKGPSTACGDAPEQMSFPLRDDSRQRIDHVFMPVAAVIDSARQLKHGSVALVCAQGISRSAAVAISYLMLREGLSLDEALAQARAARPIVAPNPSFMDALSRLERHLRHGLTRDSMSLVRPAAGPPLHAYRGVAAIMSAINATKSSISFVARAADDPDALPISLADDVIIIERAKRAGVTLWYGSQATEDIREAGFRLASDVARQQRRDAANFGGVALAPGVLNVVQQGQTPELDEQIQLELSR